MTFHESNDPHPGMAGPAASGRRVGPSGADRVRLRRLERLTRKMLRLLAARPSLGGDGRRDADAVMRLYRSLSETKPAASGGFFSPGGLAHPPRAPWTWRNIITARGAWAATMRRPPGSRPRATRGRLAGLGAARGRGRPRDLAAWAEFHAQVERLADEDREAFDLLWYQELSQAEAAALLGVSSNGRETPLGLGTASIAEGDLGRAAGVLRCRGANARRRDLLPAQP